MDNNPVHLCVTCKHDAQSLKREPCCTCYTRMGRPLWCRREADQLVINTPTCRPPDITEPAVETKQEITVTTGEPGVTITQDCSAQISTVVAPPTVMVVEQPIVTVADQPKKRGRPAGSKNKPKAEEPSVAATCTVETVKPAVETVQPAVVNQPPADAGTVVDPPKKPRGRPAGSKNKPKVEETVVTVVTTETVQPKPRCKKPIVDTNPPTTYIAPKLR